MESSVVGVLATLAQGGREVRPAVWELTLRALDGQQGRTGPKGAASVADVAPPCPGHCSTKEGPGSLGITGPTGGLGPQNLGNATWPAQCPGALGVGTPAEGRYLVQACLVALYSRVDSLSVNSLLHLLQLSLATSNELSLAHRLSVARRLQDQDDSFSVDEVFDAVHLCSKLAIKISGERLDQWCDRVMEGTGGAFRPGKLVNFCTALYGLGHEPPPQWLVKLYDRLQPALGCIKVVELVELATVVACWRQHPSSQWLLAFSQQVQAQAKQLTADRLGALLCAVVYLNAKPPSSWIHQLLIRTRTTLHAMDGSHVTACLWALQNLGYSPSLIWQRAVLQRLHHLLTVNQLPISSLPMLLWCLSSSKSTDLKLSSLRRHLIFKLLMKCRTSGQHLRPLDISILYWVQSRMHSHSRIPPHHLLLNPWSIATSICDNGQLSPDECLFVRGLQAAFLISLARLCIQQEWVTTWDWQTSYIKAATSLLPTISATDLSKLLAVLPIVLRADPSSFMTSFNFHTLKLLRRFSLQQLVQLPGHLTSWSTHIDPSWLSRFYTVSMGRMPKMSCEQLVLLLANISRLTGVNSPTQHLPPPASSYVNWVIERSYPGLSTLGPGLLSDFLFSVALLGQPPPSKWIRVMRQCCKEALPQFTSCQLSRVIWSMAVLDHHPGKSWMELFLVEVGGRLAEFDQSALADVLWSCAVLDEKPGKQFLDGFLSESFAKLPQFDPHSLAVTIWALALLHHQPRHAWMAKYLSRCLVVLDSFTPPQLAKLLWSVVVLNGEPGEQWMNEYMQRVENMVMQLDGHSLAEVVWALDKLDKSEERQWTRHFVTLARDQMLKMMPPKLMPLRSLSKPKVQRGPTID